MPDITIHVDDLLITDDNATLADAEIAKLHEALPLTQCLEPKYFLGSNLHVHSNESMSMSSQAYVRQLVDTLPKPLASYPKYSTPAPKIFAARTKRRFCSKTQRRPSIPSA